MKVNKAESAKELEALRKVLKPGMEICTILRHVSRSGMMREISLKAIVNGQIIGLDYSASAILGWGRGNGIKVSGCGMDMGFHLVYCLSRALYPAGFKLAKGAYGRNGDTSGYDKDGGYALRQRWI